MLVWSGPKTRWTLLPGWLRLQNGLGPRRYLTGVGTTLTSCDYQSLADWTKSKFENWVGVSISRRRPVQ